MLLLSGCGDANGRKSSLRFAPLKTKFRPLFSQPEVFVEILSYLERVDVDKCMLLHFSASELIRHYGHGMAKHRLLVSFYHWDVSDLLLDA